MGGIGFSELLLIFVIVMILFGAKKLPEFARGLGQALREFRRAAKEVEEPIIETKGALSEAVTESEEKTEKQKTEEEGN